MNDLKVLLTQEEVRYNQILMNRYQPRSANANEAEIVTNQLNQEIENNI